jgi:hypothetical protein
MDPAMQTGEKAGVIGGLRTFAAEQRRPSAGVARKIFARGPCNGLSAA